MENQSYNRLFKALLRGKVELSVLRNYFLESILITEDVYNGIDNSGFIVEAKSTCGEIPGTKYSYRIDRPFGEQKPGNIKHIHILVKGKDMFAMNADGTGHDGCHNVQIPQDVSDFMTKIGFQVPSNGIIEFYYAANCHLLMESVNFQMLPTGLAQLAMFFGEIIRNSHDFQLIESNIPSADVVIMSQEKYGFVDVRPLPIAIDQNHYQSFKNFLIHALDDYNNFNADVITLNDSRSYSYALYVGSR